MTDGESILCFGEIVWDAMPEGIFLGGAPLNVAYHLSRLGHPARPVSRIGRDFLGAETIRRLRDSGVAADLIQIDDVHPTGAVVISLDEDGNATYDIIEPVAWDFIEPREDLLEEARGARAVVYGTLATRSAVNARVLGNLLELIPFSVCDVNLRKPYDDPRNALDWARRASVVKLNEEELGILAPNPCDPQLESRVAALAEKVTARTIIVTRGGKGAYVWHEGGGLLREGPRVQVEDTVGAGDAFTAAFMSVFMESGSVEKSLDLALRLGAYVASQRGAQPGYDPADFRG